MSNEILEWIHQVLGNLVRNYKIQQTYVDKNDPWKGILDAAEFSICSTTNRQKCYSPFQMIFGREMIVPIKHRVGYELILQQKQTQINRNNVRDNKHRVHYYYKFRDKVMLTNHTAYKY